MLSAVCFCYAIESLVVFHLLMIRADHKVDLAPGSIYPCVSVFCCGVFVLLVELLLDVDAPSTIIPSSSAIICANVLYISDLPKYPGTFDVEFLASSVGEALSTLCVQYSMVSHGVKGKKVDSCIIWCVFIATAGAAHYLDYSFGKLQWGRVWLRGT